MVEVWFVTNCADLNTQFSGLRGFAMQLKNFVCCICTSLQRIANAKYEIFANLDLALIGQPLPNTTLFIQRDAVGQSQLTFRVDICYWSDLPDSWKSQLLAEVLQ